MIRRFSFWVVFVVFVFSLFLFTSVKATPLQYEIVATNLDNPRGLAFGPDGALYIAESGIGGDGTDGRCVANGAGATVCFGATGAVTKVMAGVQERVVEGLPSLMNPTDGSDGTGPHSLAFDANGDMYVLIGLGGDPLTMRDPDGPLGDEGPNFGQIVKVNADATWANWADVTAYEEANNPDGVVIDSNPFALLATDNGFVAADAGGNDLLAIDGVGVISTLAVIPTGTAEFPPGTGTMIPMQAVPTSVIADGSDYLVGQLTGFPFPVGGANVYSVAGSGGDPVVDEAGFTNILGIAKDGDGNLYVLEMATNGLLSGDTTGALIRVNSDGSRETLMNTGLVFPTGMTLGPDGMLYISNYGVFNSAGGPFAGEVIRFDPSAPTDVRLTGFEGAPAGTLPWLFLVVVIGLLGLGLALRRPHTR